MKVWNLIFSVTLIHVNTIDKIIRQRHANTVSRDVVYIRLQSRSQVCGATCFRKYL